ncbi:MAG: family 78 glycoside hydrolase catalytic domain [Clostridia bacterium]|nr:family 78 glycoside hydrolase catalytic domain [Clostridia bacterium]
MFKNAKWIWYEETGNINSYGEFYSAFNSCGNETVKLSCDGDYALFINGRFVSSNQYGDFEHYKSVDEIDISKYTINGKNHLAIVVWHFGKSTQRYKKYNAGVIFEIYDKTGICLSSNESVLSRKSSTYVSGFNREISPQLGFSYKYDATNEDLWTQGQVKGFNCSILANKNCVFVPRPSKKLLLGEFISAKELYNDGKVRIFDLGKEYVGLLSFKLTSPCVDNINISYGEYLENGFVKRIIHNRDFSIDYVAKMGENAHTSYMLRFACRYIQIECNSDTVIDKIGIIPQYYPVKAKEINSLDGAYKEIYLACLNTLNLCMMEHYVDCPWREQCLYAFDSRNQMLSGYYAFEGGNFEYAKSNLILMSKDLRNDGLLSICYPCGIDLTIPSFSLHYITAIKEYIEYSKDISIINEVDFKLKEILTTFLGNMKNGLATTFTNSCHWNFYDWSPLLDGYIPDCEKGKIDEMASLLLLYALRSYKKICELCALSFEYENIINELSINIKREFYSKERGIILTKDKGIELANALAVLTEATSIEESKKICELLTQGDLISCSLSMKCFVYDALLKVDKEKYKSFVLDDIKKNYTPMLKTKTVWETVSGKDDFDGAGSLCHGWSSMPIYYFNIL